MTPENTCTICWIRRGFFRRSPREKCLEDLQADRGFRSAVERELQIIGEACFALERVAPGVAGGIGEYKRIIRLRHILVHGYDVVDPDIIWEIVTNKIPALMQGLEALTNESEPAS